MKKAKLYYLVDKEDKQLLITYAVRVDTSKTSITIDDKEFVKKEKFKR